MQHELLFLERGPQPVLEDGSCAVSRLISGR